METRRYRNVKRNSSPPAKITLAEADTCPHTCYSHKLCRSDVCDRWLALGMAGGDGDFLTLARQTLPRADLNFVADESRIFVGRTSNSRRPNQSWGPFRDTFHAESKSAII